MLIYKKTSTLAVRHVFDPQSLGSVAEMAVKGGPHALGRIAEEAAGKFAGDWVRKMASGVRAHFTDHSEKLSGTLDTANELAWKAIEVALGGRRFWDRFASAEDRALREQVRAFFDAGVAADDPGFLAACLAELRQARARGHLDAGEAFRPEALAEEVAPFARFDDPESLLTAECATVEEVAIEFQRLGYEHLGRLLAVTPTRGQPLLAMAAQYYFRRAIGEDPVLARELTWARLSTIALHVREGFDRLSLIQDRHGRAIEQTLEGIARMEVVAVATRDAVLDLQDDVRGLANQFKLIRRELTAGHSVSYRDERERALIEEVKRRYRALPEDRRHRHPQLGLDVARLEVVAGHFPDALATAREAAGQFDDPAAKAEAHHAAFRAALELHAWDEALAEMLKAAAADPCYTLWPPHKYEVERILGAGAFGVALLCRDLDLDRQVVLKCFEPTGVDRDAADVFREARILENLHHPGIIHLHGCGYADPARKRRPYLEIAHFAGGSSLDDHVRREGLLAPDDLLPIAVQAAEALKAAHDAGVWHRDVKPGNLLVRQGTAGWEVKVIDFGLSLRRSLVCDSQARGLARDRSMVGSAIAGTLHFAAPEQLDPWRSREVGPHSDVFAFGRTCLFALFRTTQPRSRAIRELPEPWPDLLDDCCDPEIESRPPDFIAVLDRLVTGPVILPVPQNRRGEEEKHDNAAACFNSGKSRMIEGDFDGAIADFDRATELEPNFYDVYITRSLSRLLLLDLNGAMADFDQAVCINPDRALAYAARSEARYDLGDYDGAVEDLDEAIGLDPENAAFYRSRGIARRERGDYDGAVEDFDEAIRLDPSFGDAYRDRGDTLSADDGDNNYRDYAGSIEDYTEAIRLHPGDHVAYNNRASTRSTEGDYKGAIADYSEAIRLRPEDGMIYHNRASARDGMGDLDGAIADYSEAIRLGCHEAGTYHMRGQIYEKKGDLEKALADYTEANRRNPQVPQIETALKRVQKIVIKIDK